MLAQVKWIKIVVDIFDDEKILLIESMPDADSIIVIWFKLLCFAGKVNNGGVMMMNDKIAYTDEMLATIFRRPVNTVRMAIRIFQDFGMVEVVNNVITIPNWSKHQTLDQLEQRKEYMRNYMAQYRERQRALAIGDGKDNGKANCKVNSKVNVNEADKEVDIDKEEGDIEEDKTPPTPCQDIRDLWNSTCVSFSKVSTIGATRQKHLRARWEQFGRDIAVFTEAFQRLEASDFCKGENDRGWRASFDWLIQNDLNMAKVLEGKYDNRLKVVRGGGTWEERNPDVKDDPFFKRRRVRDAAGG